ncbi:MAG TPA: NAD(P)H-binding protein [Solirubrobacterales bacterium]|nr:NAD(P)H-binding protein [Solirubrobacterales bacterium]
MRAAVVGGTGTLGRLVVDELLERGAAVRVLSRRDPGDLPAGVEHRRADLSSGEGLVGGLADVEVVVGAANSFRGSKQVLVAGSERLLAAGSEAGVGHYVEISIVGCDRVPYPYYRVKVAQEQALEAGPLPWTLLRATQFHQLLDWAFAAAARFGVRPTGAARFQSIAAAAVATRLADAALAEPAGRLPDLAGPQVQTLGELSAQWAQARRRRRLPLRIPSWGGLGRALAAGGLCDPRASAPGQTFAEWLTDG